MARRGLVAVVSLNNGCFLQEALRAAGVGSREDGASIKVLGVHSNEGGVEEWILVQGSSRSISRFISVLKKFKGVYYSILSRDSKSSLLLIRIPREYCPGQETCPIRRSPPRSLVLSSRIDSDKLVIVLMTTTKDSLKHIEEGGFRVEDVMRVDDLDYYITPKQEELLLKAYAKGYYRFPRTVSLKDLAVEQGVSVSTLDESLRKAEAKIVKWFIIKELPHSLLKKSLADEITR
ncbi:MAG: helix-turn-helix domain-containing protein [Desulfurococcales archaeon]|nr:helix-turn-helix domain-containing protein [Desulfurococcales archaeon]